MTETPTTVTFDLESAVGEVHVEREIERGGITTRVYRDMPDGHRLLMDVSFVPCQRHDDYPYWRIQ